MSEVMALHKNGGCAGNGGHYFQGLRRLIAAVGERFCKLAVESVSQWNIGTEYYSK